MSSDASILGAARAGVRTRGAEALLTVAETGDFALATALHAVGRGRTVVARRG
jgi:hypothetical protein